MARPPQCDCPSRAPHEIYRDMTYIVKFMSEDADRRVFRKFGKLEMYNLLFLQHELAHITKKVLEYEASGKKTEMELLGATLPQLNNLLNEYHVAVRRFKEIENVPALPKYLERSLKALSITKENCSLDHELKIGDGWGDIAPIITKDKGIIHRFIDDQPNLSEQFSRFTNYNKKSALYLYSEYAVRVVEQVIVNCVILLSIGLPVFLFTRVASITGKFWVTLGFITIAIPLLSVLVPQADKTQVTLIFGYSALLVAFTSQK